MGVPHTADSSLYLLRLPHLLLIFLLPILVFYAVLAVWVFRTVHGAYRNQGTSGPSDTGHTPLDSGTPMAETELPHSPPTDLLMRVIGSGAA